MITSTSTFGGWLEALETLAAELGIVVPAELDCFRVRFDAGQSPREALEDFASS